MYRLAFLCLSAIAATPVAAVPRGPRLIVPADLSAATVRPVRVEGLPPGVRATITAVQRRTRDDAKVAEAVFITDRSGRIDTRFAIPVSGTYSGREPLGMFWSAAARPSVIGDPVVGQARITVTTDGVEVTSRTTRLFADPERVILSRDTPFAGAIWVRPADGRRHPVIVVLGGSEGGSATAREIAPLLAAGGFAVLGLPYYDPGYDPSDRISNLPRSFTNIPVDRLAAVHEWLRRQPCVRGRRIGIWGVSKGSEFALIAASRYRWIGAVVAVVPSDLVWEGWGGAGAKTASFSFEGTSLPFEPYAGMEAEQAKAVRGERMDMRRIHVDGRAANPDKVAAARIRVERFRGRLLLVAGGRDQVWPSAEMARNIVATRKRAGLATQLVLGPLANHFLAGPGTKPTAPLATPGSDPRAIAHTRERAWNDTFALFHRALGR